MESMKRLNSEEETRRILSEFNNTETDFDKDKTIGILFEEQVMRTPAAPAVIFKGQQMTYRDLNERVNRLAFFLRDQGVRPNSIVAIMVERSFELIIGIFGILKAGGAYLPIDPHNPLERTRHILSDSRTDLLLTQNKFFGKIRTSIKKINLEDPDIYRRNAAPFVHVNDPEDLAYVIYTSGSTGYPKGVMIEHRSVVNRLNWMQKKYPLSGDDTILQKTPFFFDVSVWELFWWSFVGGAVCLMLPGYEKFPQAIVGTVESNNITVMHFVPSMLSAFLDYIANSADVEKLSGLKRVFASGETLKPSHLERFNKILYSQNGTRLTNLYGPTEATVDVSYFDCPTDFILKSVPIGKPIDNINLLILNEDIQICPIGVLGELYISGVGLARGYLNRPQLTDEKFIQTPWQSTGKFYRSGDLACWLPDGNIEFQGRLDNQIKIRGLRIELGEIEALLSSHPSIGDCVVLVKNTTETIVTLTAFLAANNELRPKELKAFLTPLLPDYMIPNEFVFLDTLPLTANGKLDRKKLARGLE
jgi:amino acid adenylation domain-containing protein